MLRYRHDGRNKSTTSDLRHHGKAESMIKANHINTLIYAKSIVNEMYDDTVLLCDRKNLTKVVYNDSDDITLYCLNDFNVIERAQDTVPENQFSELFYEAEDWVNPKRDEAEYYENDNGFVLVAEYRNGEIRTVGSRRPQWLVELLQFMDAAEK